MQHGVVGALRSLGEDISLDVRCQAVLGWSEDEARAAVDRLPGGHVANHQQLDDALYTGKESLNTILLGMLEV